VEHDAGLPSQHVRCSLAHDGAPPSHQCALLIPARDGGACARPVWCGGAVVRCASVVQVRIVRRDTNAKEDVPLSVVAQKVALLLVQMQHELLQRATDKRDAAVVKVTEWKDFVPTMQAAKLALTPFCNDEEVPDEDHQPWPHLLAHQTTIDPHSPGRTSNLLAHRPWSLIMLSGRRRPMRSSSRTSRRRRRSRRPARKARTSARRRPLRPRRCASRSSSPSCPQAPSASSQARWRRAGCCGAAHTEGRRPHARLVLARRSAWPTGRSCVRVAVMR
jgi:hypothetical protein